MALAMDLVKSIFLATATSYRRYCVDFKVTSQLFPLGLCKHRGQHSYPTAFTIAAAQWILDSATRVVLPFETCFIFYTNTGTIAAFQGRCHFNCKGGILCTKVFCKYVYKKIKYCIRMLCKLYYYILVCVTAHILSGILSLRNPCLSPRIFLSTESEIILYTCERNILLKIYLCAKKFLVCFCPECHQLLMYI